MCLRILLWNTLDIFTFVFAIPPKYYLLTNKLYIQNVAYLLKNVCDIVITFLEVLYRA